MTTRAISRKIHMFFCTSSKCAFGRSQFHELLGFLRVTPSAAQERALRAIQRVAENIWEDWRRLWRRLSRLGRLGTLGSRLPRLGWTNGRSSHVSAKKKHLIHLFVRPTRSDRWKVRWEVRKKEHFKKVKLDWSVIKNEEYVWDSLNKNHLCGAIFRREDF